MASFFRCCRRRRRRGGSGTAAVPRSWRAVLRRRRRPPLLQPPAHRRQGRRCRRRRRRPSRRTTGSVAAISQQEPPPAGLVLPSFSAPRTSSSPAELVSWRKVIRASFCNFFSPLCVLWIKPHILSRLHIYFFSLSLSLLTVLIEKILRTNPNVGKIYVLIKAKDGEAALRRLQNEVCMASIH